MTMRKLRNIRVQSEFQGLTGDCTQDAADTALASAYPGRYPVTPAELNALAKEAIDAGEAGTSGAMTPAQLAWLLDHERVPFTQLVTPDWSNLAAFTTWQAVVKQWGGIKPMIVQLAHGEWLPGSWSNPKGPAVGHAVALIGYDPATGAVLLGDGNSSFGGNGEPTVCPWSTLTQALPYALTIIEVEAGETTVTTPSADTTGLGSGFAKYATEHQVQGPVKVHETGVPGGEKGAVYAVLGDNTLLFYTPTKGVQALPEVGAVVAQAQAVIDALHSQLAALQTQLAAMQAAHTQDAAHLDGLGTQLAALEAKVAQARLDAAATAKDLA